MELLLLIFLAATVLYYLKHENVSNVRLHILAMIYTMSSLHDISRFDVYK